VTAPTTSGVGPSVPAPDPDASPARGCEVNAGAAVIGEDAAAPALVIEVRGVPAPQGSKRGFVNKGGGVSMVESSKKVKPWRESVKYAAVDAMHATTCPVDCPGWAYPLAGPVHLAITFRFARPKFHFRTGKNAHLLRDAAPVFPSGRPDLDKCLRSSLDALGEAGVFRDDAQVVHITARKHYADLQPPGARIVVRAL
jgi:Holliday junction resolvase RusA-like endonuclease